MPKMSRVLASLLLLACGPSAPAQSAPTQLTYSMFVNVLDRNGNAVRDLPKDSFRVEVNKRPAPVLEANYSLGPRRIAVLLDISSSMAEDSQNQKWRIAHEALDDLLAETPQEVAIAFLTFSDRVHDSFDFSQSRSSIAAWIKEGPSQTNIKIHGQTALYDAVVAADKMFGTARPGDAIYAITDGGDNRSLISETATRKLLSISGVRFFVFLLSERLPSELERSRRDDVLDIARATGGFVFGIPGRHSLAGVQFVPSYDYEYDYDDRTRQKIKLYTQALNIQINGFYTLRIESPVAPDKVRRVSLDIVDGTGKLRKDVTFTYSSALPLQPK